MRVVLSALVRMPAAEAVVAPRRGRRHWRGIRAVRRRGIPDRRTRSSGRNTRTGDTTATAEVVVSSVRAGTRHHDALSPPVASPGVTRDCQRFSRPSPFHPLFEDRTRYAGNSEIQHPWGLAGDGETRTRTGDTTIFSRAVACLERARKCCKYAGYRGSTKSRQAPQIPFFSRRFGRCQVPRLPIAASALGGSLDR